MPVVTQWMDGLRAWWAAATPATRAMATGLALLLVVGLAVAASLAASPDYRAIYHGVSGKDAAAIETVLRDHAIPMHFDDKDGTISVPAKDEGNAHMYIESASILNKDSNVVGIESLKNLGFGISSQNETQQILAANEGELSRKLMRLDPVQSAAVSITLPSTSAFVGTDKPPTAAILLTLKPGETLSNLQVKGIVNLVAHSVSDLTPANVTLTDQSGVPLWTDNGTGDPGTDEPSKKNAQFSEGEGKRLQAMLDGTFGPHKTVVTVTAELNFDQIHKDETDHPVPATPGGAAGTLVSTRTSEESYSGAGAPPAVGGVAGTGSNLNVPSYQTGGAAGGGGKYTKTDTTENHETNISHTVTNVAPGAVRKESVAALVDTSIPAENIAKIKDIIGSAILAQPGDPSRFVSVQQIAFDTSAQKARDAQSKAQGTQILMGNIARALAVCVVAVVLLILLTRGGAGRKGASAPAAPRLALAGGGANVGYLDADAPDLEMAAILGQVPSGRGLAQMAEERPLTVEDVLSEMPEPEGRQRRRPRAPSIEEQQDLKMESIRTMVAAHPESVALLMKGWMAEDMKVS